MNEFANALSSGLTADAMWGAVTPFVGIIITCTLVALGFYIVNKNTKAFGKHKAGKV